MAFAPIAVILDGETADLTPSADVFLTLVPTGTVVKDDYIGAGKYQLSLVGAKFPTASIPRPYGPRQDLAVW